MNFEEIMQIGRTIFHDPIITKAAPNGDGEIHYVRKSHGYEARRIEGPRSLARHYAFGTAADLARFIADEERYPEHGRMDILVGQNSIVVDPTPRDPKGDYLVYTYATHPLFQQWLSTFDRTVTQRNLFKLLRASTPIMLEADRARWLANLGVLTVVSGGQVKQQIDELGYTRITGGEQSREVTTSLAPTINLHTPIFEGVATPDGREPSYDVEILVSFDTEALCFELSCPMLPVVRASAVGDLAALFEQRLDDTFLVVRGEHETRTVPQSPDDSEEIEE